MKSKVLVKKHKNLGNGVHQVSELSITKGGRVKDSVTTTEKLNDRGDLHVVTETVYETPTNKTLYNLKKKGLNVKVANGGTNKKKTSSKKKTKTKPRKVTAKKSIGKRKNPKKATVRKAAHKRRKK